MSRASPRVREWVIEASGPRTIDAVLAALGDPGALDAGRVALDGRRVDRSTRALVPGDRIEVYAPRAIVDEPAVLAEHAGFVVAFKPPELSTEPDRTGSGASLSRWLARELGIGERELHAVSRLDVGVSGAVLFARTRTARRRAAKGHSRRYVALLSQGPEPATGIWTCAIDGRPARTRFDGLARADALVLPDGAACQPALVALDPETGRTHQLRIHAARAGAPILGDRAHGGPRRLIRADGRVVEAARVALHALRVVIPDGPAVVAPLPADLLSLWQELGGEDRDWSRADDVARWSDP